MEKISNISNYDYHHGKYKDYISSSNLKNILQSPEYFKTQKNIIRTPSASMQLGTAVHTAILEPEKYDSEVGVIKKVTGTGSVAANKKLLEEVAHKNTVITEAQSEIVTCITEKFHSITELVRLFSGGEAEVSIFWDDWKIRPDYLKDDLVIDLKTTSKPLNEFNKACANFMYDLSAGMYKFGAGVQNYKFVVVETNPPYNFVIFEPDAEFMHEGREKCLLAMDRYLECKKYNVWPGVELNQTLTLPKWYIGGYSGNI